MVTQSRYSKKIVYAHKNAPSCPECGWKIPIYQLNQLYMEAVKNDGKRSNVILKWSCNTDIHRIKANNIEWVEKYGCPGRTLTLSVKVVDVPRKKRISQHAKK